MRRAAPVVVFLAATLVACGGGRSEPSRQPAALPAAGTASGLVADLRRGGYVIAFRHAATDFSMSDTARSYADCARQRNLSAAGRRQARAIGRAFRSLGIPVGAVVASPYCRTRDTARLAFGRATPTADLLSEQGALHGERNLPSRLRARLRKRPTTGTNTVLVSHQFAIAGATGTDVAEGEAAIFRPGGSQPGFRFVRKVSAERWSALAHAATPAAATRPRVREYSVPPGSHPHDVAPARDGRVWFTAQGSGHLGRLDPRTGRSRMIALGEGAAPHGVIVGPDGAPWITDGGLNAIVRVDPRTLRVRRFPLPADHSGANLNTATFDRGGRLWFTGQSGVYGSVDPRTGRVRAFDAPRGPGPYGIATTPRGQVWYASLAGSHIARIETATERAAIAEPPTSGQGARRIWADSRGRLWVSEYNAGRVARYDPDSRRWREWRLPGDSSQPYAVYVDDRDIVWLTDFGQDAVVRFDPHSERFTTIRLPTRQAAVRQLGGRSGEVWGAESAADKLVVLTTG
jgi:virginiamycin B lyase